MNYKLNKKALSPILAIILLLVVAVVIVTMISNWVNVFTNKNLSKLNEFVKDSDLEGLITSGGAKDNKIIIENNSNVILNIKSYKIVDNTTEYSSSLYDFESIKSINPDATILIDVSCLPSSDFDLLLYTTNNKFVTVKVNADNYSQFNCVINQKDCPLGYVYVPGNPEYNTDDGFCVMRYEAKVDNNGDGIGDSDCNNNDVSIVQWVYGTGGSNKAYLKNFWNPSYREYNSFSPKFCNIDNNERKIVSSAEGNVLINVSQNEARKYCSQLGSNYHLITNNEWMTLARNLETVGSNWSSGHSGSGKLKVGNCCLHSFFAIHLLEGEFYGCSSDPDNVIQKGFDRNQNAKLILSNGEAIWDVSGNVKEWVDAIIIEADDGYFDGSEQQCIDYEGVTGENISRTFGNDRISTFEFEDILDPGILGFDGIIPSNINLNHENGVGRVVGCPGFANSSGSSKTGVGNGVNKFAYNSAKHGIVRGGSWSEPLTSGIYAIDTRYSPDFKNLQTSIGFRCVYNPLE